MPGRVAGLVGRHDQRRILARTLTAARDGAGRALFLAGGRGVGKSRLVAAATDLATAAGMRTLTGRSSVIGPTIPLRPLREALVTLPGALDPDRVAELGPRLAPAAYLAESGVLPRRPAHLVGTSERSALLLELLGLHRQLRGVATNLNQAVAKLHTWGQPVAELPAIAATVDRLMRAVDDAVARLAAERSGPRDDPRRA